MEEEQHRCESSTGSEARPNTPFMDPFVRLNLLEDNNGHKSSTEDQSIHQILPPKATENATKPQWSYKHSSFARRKTLPNLPSLKEEQDLISIERNDMDDEIATNEINGRKCDRRSDHCKTIVFSSNKNSGNPTKTTTNGSKNEVSLPKILIVYRVLDTYCISCVRPSTNHGFAYAVSSTDLLNGKHTIVKRTKHQKAKFKSKISTPENGLSRQGSVYLLFRAPSRACGLNISGLKGRSKELHHLKDAKRRKTGATKNAVQTNIVRLPDINQDMWK